MQGYPLPIEMLEKAIHALYEVKYYQMKIK